MEKKRGCKVTEDNGITEKAMVKIAHTLINGIAPAKVQPLFDQTVPFPERKIGALIGLL